MRMKNLLGLLAIGGAVAYAQKRRGGDMSLQGFKNSFSELVGNVKNQVSQLQNKVGGGQGSVSRTQQDVGSSRGIGDAYSSTSGYSSGYSPSNPVGTNGSNRKF